jgi:hypothetical protein
MHDAVDFEQRFIEVSTRLRVGLAAKRSEATLFGMSSFLQRLIRRAT